MNCQKNYHDTKLKLVEFEFDLDGAGTSWTKDSSKLLGISGQPVNRVRAVFKLNTVVDPDAQGLDYVLITMYPVL